MNNQEKERVVLIKNLKDQYCGKQTRYSDIVKVIDLYKLSPEETSYIFFDAR